MSPDVPDPLPALVEHLVLSGILDEATAEANARIAADPEWTTPHVCSVKDLVAAFAVGTIEADPQHTGYRLPPHFEEVLNYISACAQHDLKERTRHEELFDISLIEARRLFLLWGESNPHFMQWNEVEDGETTMGVAITTRYSPVATKRQFIDLHALVQNAAIYLRDEWRQWDAFNREFEAKHGKLS